MLEIFVITCIIFLIIDLALMWLEAGKKEE